MSEETKQDAKFKWDAFYVGPEGFDEHVGVTSDSAAEMTKGRETIVKGLTDIKAKPKWGGATATPAASPTSSGASPDAMVAAAAAAGVAKVCPKHNTQMRPNTKGGIPGVSQHVAKSGNTYTCFWVCTTDKDCKER